ncbi:MAG: hypothetical protein RSD27_07395 [Ruthenibacterium sp.]
MLHDPSHSATMPIAEEIHLTQAEKDILRALGAEIAAIAALPVHAEKATLWKALNDKKSVRPMVWINEIPWHEMNVDDELTLRCVHPWARELEDKLRKTIYQWRHMPGDMIVSDFIECPLIIHSTDFGIVEQVRLAKTDENNEIVSREFVVQLADFDDIEKIKMPKLTYLAQETEHAFALMQEIFAGIIPVKKVGQTHIWYTPWDYLIRWWGVENAMIDLVDQPELVHAAYERMVAAWMTELDQFEQMNLLALDCNNTRIGSGGYGYVSDLPAQPYAPEHVMAHNMWGCANAQIFSSVSPEMHWEFAVEHDLKWLSRFGLTYYGCCEPLDGKADVLRRIPNLRKVSVSPWCNTARAVENLGGSYVLSHKPSPAVFATSSYDAAQAESQLRTFLETARGCHTELIMKDISTVKYQPQRLWDWEKTAMRLAQEYETK